MHFSLDILSVRYDLFNVDIFNKITLRPLSYSKFSLVK